MYVSITEAEIFGSAQEKKAHFEKMAFKDMYCNWNLQTQTSAMKETLKMYFGCFLSTSLKNYFIFAQNLKIELCM